MKIVTLNTWGGRAGKDKILGFLRQHKANIDVFCLQEVWSAPHKDFANRPAGGNLIDYAQTMTEGVQEISTELSEYSAYFRPHLGDNYGLMMLVKKDIKVVAEGEVFVYREKGYIPDTDLGNHARNIQYVTLLKEGKPVTVINFHGIWNGQGKTDTEDRLNQSKNIIKFIASLEGECVFCGDFNLLPETQSLRLFEESGLENMIKKYKVSSTRSSFYTKPEKFADYIFLSPGLQEKDFKVLSDEISDHLPLYIEV